MKKILMLSAAATLLFVGLAHADPGTPNLPEGGYKAKPTDPGFVTDQKAPAPVVPATADASLPSGCGVIQVLRPNPKGPNIQLTFTGYATNVEAFQACNPERLVAAGVINVTNVGPSKTGGTRLSIKLDAPEKPARIGYPTAANGVRVAQAVCDEAGGKIAYKRYAASWSDAPAGVVTMTDVTSQDNEKDAAYYTATCAAARPAGR